MVEIYNETGDVVMSIESLSREGGTLVIEGRLMGAWKSKMYFPSKELPGMLKIMASFSVIAFILLAPFTLIKERNKRRKSSTKSLVKRT